MSALELTLAATAIVVWGVAVYCLGQLFDQLTRMRRIRDLTIHHPPHPRCEREGSIESFRRRLEANRLAVTEFTTPTVKE